MEDCWLEGTSSSAGGAASFGGSLTDQVVVRRCTIVSSFGGVGVSGGLYAGGRVIAVEGNTFLGNAIGTDWIDGGSAARLSASVSGTFFHNVIANSSGEQAVRKSPLVTEGCSVFWNNAAGNVSGFVSDPTDPEADPLFWDPTAGDLHVGVGSPCLPGTGHPACTELIGAHGEGCGTVSVRPRSWGSIKGDYRGESEVRR